MVVGRAEAIQAKPDKPRLVGMRSKRVNGKLVGAAQFEDGSERPFEASRVNGEMVGTIQ
jgi:hypothetical protein